MNPPAISIPHLLRQRSYRSSVEILLACFASALAVLSVGYPILFAILLAGCILILAAFRVTGLLYLIVFCLPYAPLLNTNFAIRDVSSLLRFGLFAGVGVGCLAGKGRVREWLLGGWANTSVIMYALISLLSVIAFNQVNPTSQRAIFRLLAYIALYFAVTGWVRSRQEVESLVHIIIVSTIVVALYGIYQAVIDDYGTFYFRMYPIQEEGVQPWEGRVSSFLFHFNSLAGYLNLVLPFCLAVIATSKKEGQFRRLAGFCLVLGVLALVLTQSRGGLIAFAGTILLGLWFLPGNKSLRLWLLGFFPIGVLLLIPVLSLYSKRFSSVDEFTATGRLMFFGAAWRLFLSKPLVGVGYGNFRELYATLIPGVPGGVLDSHNLYLQLLSETGVLGFCVFLTIMVVTVRLGLRQFRNPLSPLDRVVGFGAVAAIASMLIHGFVDFLFITSPQFGALFWLILGLVVANETLRSAFASAATPFSARSQITAGA